MVEGEFGVFGDCVGSGRPSDEECNDLDDDCDGAIDETCECVVGESRTCYTGSEFTQDVGECHGGTQVCSGEEGLWGECLGDVLPVPEACGDGLDNDCDGETDEDCECVGEECACVVGETRPCYRGPSWARGVGRCHDGSERCEETSDGPAWSTCSGYTLPVDERCGDGIDDDCNGLVDDGCRPTDRCVTAPGGSESSVVLSYTNELRTADVVFVVDETGSMSGLISSVRSTLLTDIIPGLGAEISDIQMGVAGFRDFAYSSYGSSGDQPFVSYANVTSSTSSVSTAVSSLSASGGGDTPESHVEALYQLATGEGIGTYVSPASSCAGGRIGYLCLRPDAVPVVLLFSDAPFHNGPSGEDAYTGIYPTPHTYAQAVAALSSIGARVIGFDASGYGGSTADLTDLARDTGAVDSTGSALVFDVSSGSAVGPQVVDAVRTFANEASADVDVLIEDVSGTGGVALLDRIVATGAIPSSGATIVGDHYVDVEPGTEVGFRVVFGPGASTGAAREHVVRLVIRLNGATRAEEMEIRIVEPGGTATRCE
jgi:hypothetical protein